MKKHRLAAGMTQEQLGFEAELQRKYITKIEGGATQPSITTVFKLAIALKVKPSRLLADTEKICFPFSS